MEPMGLRNCYVQALMKVNSQPFAETTSSQKKKSLKRKERTSTRATTLTQTGKRCKKSKHRSRSKRNTTKACEYSYTEGDHMDLDTFEQYGSQTALDLDVIPYLQDGSSKDDLVRELENYNKRAHSVGMKVPDVETDNESSITSKSIPSTSKHHSWGSEVTSPTHSGSSTCLIDWSDLGCMSECRRPETDLQCFPKDNETLKTNVRHVSDSGKTMTAGARYHIDSARREMMSLSTAHKTPLKQLPMYATQATAEEELAMGFKRRRTEAASTANLISSEGICGVVLEGNCFQIQNNRHRQAFQDSGINLQGAVTDGDEHSGWHGDVHQPTSTGMHPPLAQNQLEFGSDRAKQVKKTHSETRILNVTPSPPTMPPKENTSTFKKIQSPSPDSPPAYLIQESSCCREHQPLTPVKTAQSNTVACNGQSLVTSTQSSTKMLSKTLFSTSCRNNVGSTHSLVDSQNIENIGLTLPQVSERAQALSSMSNPVQSVQASDTVQNMTSISNSVHCTNYTSTLSTSANNNKLPTSQIPERVLVLTSNKKPVQSTTSTKIQTSSQSFGCEQKSVTSTEKREQSKQLEIDTSSSHRETPMINLLSNKTLLVLLNAVLQRYTPRELEAAIGLIELSQGFRKH